MSTLDVSGKPSYRPNNSLGFFICAAILGVITLYLEPVADLQFCALCTLVRLTLLVMAAIFLLGFLTNRSVLLQRLFSLINLSLITAMLVTLGRSLFSATNAAASCTKSTTDLISSEGALNGLLISLNNAVHCPELHWNLYDLSFAHLAVLLFLILLVVVWKILIKKPQRKLFF